MKFQLLIAVLLISTGAFAQPGERFLSYRDGFRLDGFVDGQKLDTITAQYATIGWTGTGHIWLDYGQYRDGKKEMTVRDGQGMALLFEGNNMPFVLNFLFYNGWEVQQIVPAYSATSREMYLLKKRKP